MAQVTEVRLVDDIDGGEAEHALEFAVNGVTYEIDLSSVNQSQFDSALEPFIKAARRKTGTRRRQRQRRSSAQAGGTDNAAIRAWALENGHSVSDRGRISESVRRAYAEAH
jgi:hypothetical protein